MRRRCSSLNTITWSVHSCLADPIKRSTRPFCQGERKDVGRSRIPIARTRALNTAPKARSLSRIRYFGAVSHGNASVIWRANHSAVGLPVNGNRRLGDRDAEFEQFAVNLGGAPQRVLKTHSSDQVAHLSGDPRSATRRAGFPSPVAGKTLAMPAHAGLGPDDAQGIKNARV